MILVQNGRKEEWSQVGNEIIGVLGRTCMFCTDDPSVGAVAAGGSSSSPSPLLQGGAAATITVVAVTREEGVEAETGW